jgi:hypothetical protein
VVPLSVTNVGRFIKFFGPNYLINGSVRYFFWPRGAVKKIAETLRAS